MNIIDWIVLLGTLGVIVIYGSWKTRKIGSISTYLRGDEQLKWSTIGLSVMATQASAITFLSTPGQAYESGMSFVQNYFGLPIALVIVSAFFLPIYYRLKIFTAYEYLEQRFDARTRWLTASLFLLQRGLAAGITIYAPAIILSTMLEWDLSATILAVGILVIIYTVTGGSKAVSLTQKWQMTIILAGMFVAFLVITTKLPEGVSFGDALFMAGKMDKLNAISFSFDPGERYTFWTGITGGLFLALSYFGTDQSQVQRYIGGKSLRESRLGLMFNAVFKVPMQFFILLTGVMVFVFFEFQGHDLLFNRQAMKTLSNGETADEFIPLMLEHEKVMAKKGAIYMGVVTNRNEAAPSQIEAWFEAAKSLTEEEKALRAKAIDMAVAHPDLKQAKDSDYVFLTFIMDYMPHGLIGLLLAVIISAAMSSTSGELSALSSTTMVDFYQRLGWAPEDEQKKVVASKWLTAFWGAIAITFALFAHMVENMIEAVNILGSLFYGTILGIFLVGFFIRIVKGSTVFIAGILAQVTVLYIFSMYQKELAYLWYNLIGCALVVLISLLIQGFRNISTN